MKTKSSFPQIFAVVLLLTLSSAPSALSQVPQGFNYQAVAHNSAGAPIMNTTIQVKMSILADTLAPVVVWEELHSGVKTNTYGVFNLVIGAGTRESGSALTFGEVDWAKMPMFLKVQIYNQGAWKYMGSAKLWSVPYAMVTNDIGSSLKKLSVTGVTDNLNEALFEVKNKDGQTIFAVYNEGVRIYVDDAAKGPKGGFAIGGFGTVKEGKQRYLFVSGDSIRAYIDSTTVKGPKGGFAIGGFGTNKGKSGNYFDVSTDTGRIINPSQNRILWYPLKNAFMTGRVLIEKPDSVGINSFSTGYESRAIGRYSQAMGFQAIARGIFSTSIGYQSVANRDNSFAFGQWAQAKNYESYAFGRGAIAEGFRSFAFGSAGVDSAGMTTGVAYAKGEYSFAIGQGSQALGRGSVALGTADTAYNDFSQAFGLLTKASGHTATTFGYKTEAAGWAAIAIGNQTYSSGHTSFAGGSFCEATQNSSFSFGMRNLASGHNSVAFGLDCKSTGNASFATGHLSEANGDFSFSAGTSNITTGQSSFAGGQECQALNANAFAFGIKNTAGGYQSVAMGTESRAMAVNSIALGDSAISTGVDAVALGNRTFADGVSSTATGQQTTASGIVSFAGGIFAIASKHHSFSFGHSTEANGSGAVAFGTYSKSTNGESFASGYQVQAKGWQSAAFGKGTIVKSYSAFVLGRFNDTTNMTGTSDDPLFIVGNGNSDTDRKNAFTVLQNNNVGINMVNPQQMLDIAGGNGRVESGYNWLTNSDIRYKKNIETINNALDLVLAMNGVKYDLIKESPVTYPDMKSIGFIAQELETVVPEVVVTGSDGYKSVAYDKLTAVLTEAIKEQQKQIESYKSQVQSLQQEVEQIKALLLAKGTE